MNGAKEDTEDPVVAEVRQWRARMFEKAGGTIKGLVATLDKAEKQRQSKPLSDAGKRKAGKAAGRGRTSIR